MHYGRPRYREVTSLNLAHPLVPTELLRAISARTGNLEEAVEEIRLLRQVTCANAFDCVCTRCTIPRNALAGHPRPKPPTRAPHRLSPARIPVGLRLVTSFFGRDIYS